LLEKACKNWLCDEDIDELIEVLVAKWYYKPWFNFLQATERYFSGIPPLQSVLISESSKFDSMAICRAVAQVKWATCAELFKNVNKIWCSKC
jgi:hypothetical protein